MRFDHCRDRGGARRCVTATLDSPCKPSRSILAELGLYLARFDADVLCARSSCKNHPARSLGLLGDKAQFVR